MAAALQQGGAVRLGEQQRYHLVDPLGRPRGHATRRKVSSAWRSPVWTAGVSGPSNGRCVFLDRALTKQRDMDGG
jgi:hypothetical protein